MIALTACASPDTAEIIRINRPLPTAETQTYDLLDNQSHRIGSASVTIQQSGDALVLNQNYVDLQQHTDNGSVTVDAATLQPRSAHRELSTADVQSTLNVTYVGKTMMAVANDGHDHRHEAGVSPSSYDDQESFFLLRTLDFKPGYTVHYGIVVTDAKTATISRALGTAVVEGQTKITVQGKSFTAWQVKLTGAGATNTAWYDAADPARRLLRYTSGRQTQLELANP